MADAGIVHAQPRSRLPQGVPGAWRDRYDKTALVTREIDIGLAVAKIFADNGAQVIVIGRAQEAPYVGVASIAIR
jgi:hypothetical protein